MDSEIKTPNNEAKKDNQYTKDMPYSESGTGHTVEQNKSEPSDFTISKLLLIIKQRSYLLLFACVFALFYLLMLDSIFSSFRVGGFIQFIGQLSESVIVPHRVIVIMAIILNAAAWYLQNKKISIASLIAYVIGLLFFTNSFWYLLLTIILLSISLFLPLKNK